MKNEVAAVVGVGPGLGAALVKRFANEGFTTIAVARRASSWTSLRGGDGPVILTCGPPVRLLLTTSSASTSCRRLCASSFAKARCWFAHHP